MHNSEPDLSCWFNLRGDKLSDRIKNYPELLVIFTFEFLNLLSEFLVRGNKLSEFCKGSDDLNVHLDCSPTVQDT